MLGRAAEMKVGLVSSADRISEPARAAICDVSSICWLRLTGAPCQPALERPSTQASPAPNRSARRAATASGDRTWGMASIMRYTLVLLLPNQRDHRRAARARHGAAAVGLDQAVVIAGVEQVEHVQPHVVMALVPGHRGVPAGVAGDRRDVRVG